MTLYIHGFIGCTYSGSTAEVLRHKLTCKHSNVQLDTDSQQVLFTAVNKQHLVHLFANNF